MLHLHRSSYLVCCLLSALVAHEQCFPPGRRAKMARLYRFLRKSLAISFTKQDLYNRTDDFGNTDCVGYFLYRMHFTTRSCPTQEKFSLKILFKKLCNLCFFPCVPEFPKYAGLLTMFLILGSGFLRVKLKLPSESGLRRGAPAQPVPPARWRPA